MLQRGIKKSNCSVTVLATFYSWRGGRGLTGSRTQGPEETEMGQDLCTTLWNGPSIGCHGWAGDPLGACKGTHWKRWAPCVLMWGHGLLTLNKWKCFKCSFAKNIVVHFRCSETCRLGGRTTENDCGGNLASPLAEKHWASSLGLHSCPPVPSDGSGERHVVLFARRMLCATTPVSTQHTFPSPCSSQCYLWSCLSKDISGRNYLGKKREEYIS